MDTMGIASLSTSMYQSQALSQVGTAVLSMSMDDATQLASNEAAMIESLPSPNPNVGTNFSASV